MVAVVVFNLLRYAARRMLKPRDVPAIMLARCEPPFEVVLPLLALQPALLGANLGLGPRDFAQCAAPCGHGGAPGGIDVEGDAVAHPGEQQEFRPQLRPALPRSRSADRLPAARPSEPSATDTGRATCGFATGWVTVARGAAAGWRRITIAGETFVRAGRRRSASGAAETSRTSRVSRHPSPPWPPSRAP